MDNIHSSIYKRKNSDESLFPIEGGKTLKLKSQTKSPKSEVKKYSKTGKKKVSEQSENTSNKNVKNTNKKTNKARGGKNKLNSSKIAGESVDSYDSSLDDILNIVPLEGSTSLFQLHPDFLAHKPTADDKTFILTVLMSHHFEDDDAKSEQLNELKNSFEKQDANFSSEVHEFIKETPTLNIYAVALFCYIFLEANSREVCKSNVLPISQFFAKHNLKILYGIKIDDKPYYFPMRDHIHIDPKFQHKHFLYGHYNPNIKKILEYYPKTFFNHLNFLLYDLEKENNTFKGELVDLTEDDIKLVLEKVPIHINVMDFTLFSICLELYQIHKSRKEKDPFIFLKKISKKKYNVFNITIETDSLKLNYDMLLEQAKLIPGDVVLPVLKLDNEIIVNKNVLQEELKNKSGSGLEEKLLINDNSCNENSTTTQNNDKCNENSTTQNNNEKSTKIQDNIMQIDINEKRKNDVDMDNIKNIRTNTDISSDMVSIADIYNLPDITDKTICLNMYNNLKLMMNKPYHQQVTNSNVGSQINNIKTQQDTNSNIGSQVNNIKIPSKSNSRAVKQSGAKSKKNIVIEYTCQSIQEIFGIKVDQDSDIEKIDDQQILVKEPDLNKKTKLNLLKINAFIRTAPFVTLENLRSGNIIEKTVYRLREESKLVFNIRPVIVINGYCLRVKNIFSDSILFQCTSKNKFACNVSYTYRNKAEDDINQDHSEECQKHTAKFREIGHIYVTFNSDRIKI